MPLRICLPLAYTLNPASDAQFTSRISQKIYEERIDKVEQDIALAEMAAQDAKVEHLDVEAVLAFTQHLLGNTARLWLDSPVAQKVQLQWVLFPQGIEYSGTGGFRTAACSSIFNILEEFTAQDDKFGCPPGIRTPISRSRICCPTVERGGNSR